MASTTTTMPPSTSGTASKGSSKSAKSKSLIAKLRLSPELLAKIAARNSPSNSSQPNSTSSSNGSNPPTANPVAEPSPSAIGSDSNGTPVPSAATPNNLLAPPPNPVKRKGIPGPKPGMKRTASQMALDGAPKPRGKPGPKKKPRPGDVVNGVTVLPTAAPKLGPKANQGAINAHLRALDRTGKPCRKWQRSGFQLRSFTGVAWGIGSWATKGKRTDFAGDVKSDSSGSTEMMKGIQESSAAPSDKESGPDAGTPMAPIDATSSPAPGVVAAASGKA